MTRRYPAYKDSGVEWLGEVPEGWRLSQLKHVCKFQTGWTPPTGDADSYIGENLWANISDLGQAVIYDTAKRLSGEAIERHGIASCPVGSLLFSFKLSIGQVSFAGREMYTNEAIATFLPSPNIDLRFAFYAFPEMVVRNASENIYGAKMLNQQLINSAMLLVPTLLEQTAIAAFLDRETAKIDALAAEQRRLIDLLREKRQAVISHAVTRGLNPNVTLKPSGVDWLGDVPEEWMVRTISSLSTKITNGYVGPTRDILRDDGVRYLQSLHIKRNRIVFNKPYFVDEAWSNCHEKSILKRGDVLIVQTGDIGQVAVVPGEFENCNCHALIIVSPVHDTISGDWLSWVLTSSYGQQSLRSIQTGALHPHLNCGNVKFLAIPVPTLSEQSEIVNALTRKLLGFDKLIYTAEAAIALLQERRAALISAAVTGKIDVRHLSAAATEAA